MCGRYWIKSLPRKLREQLPDNWLWMVSPDQLAQDRLDIRPTQKALVVRDHGDSRRGEYLQWGIKRPIQGKDKLLINARTENIHGWPWRDVQNQRCLIVATGWYEWSDKIQYAYHYPDERIILFGGLWFTHQGINQFVILTVPSGGQLHVVDANLHDRAPLIVRPQEYQKWLDTDFNSHLLWLSSAHKEVVTTEVKA